MTMTNPMQDKKRPFKDHTAKHFLFETDADGRVATITLNRPEKKNPLTFESYEELTDLFRALGRASDVRAVVL
ncbi:enoyl-CoA hydratase, partial|nr:enoyl-CoA hydratase [Stenotrophomonas sp. SbOxS2]